MTTALTIFAAGKGTRMRSGAEFAPEHTVIVTGRGADAVAAVARAMLTLGNEAMTASGTVVTRDVPEGALALGRAEQVNKPGLARKMFDMLKSKKARKAKETS